MTRRKQNAPKRLKSSDKSGIDKSGSQQQQQNLSESNHLTSEAEEEGEDGETTSEDDANAEDQARNSAANVKLEACDGHTSPVSVVTPGGELSLEASSRFEDKAHISKEPTARKEDVKSPVRPAEVSSGLQLDVKESDWSSHVPQAGSSLTKYNYNALSPPLILHSKREGPPGQDSQMTLVMPNTPFALLSKGKSSTSPLGSNMAFFPNSPSNGDDQPLDLSTKPDKQPSRSFRDKTSKSGGDSRRSSPASSAHNEFSSLQSLQQRFGGDFPLEIKQKSGASVIPLQSSMSHKSSLGSGIQAAHGDSSLRAAASSSKQKSSSHADWLERQEVLISKGNPSSPLPKGESSPTLADEPEFGSKHTIHRCSCQKSFSTLYALSFHLQETGHTPGASKAASLMDYPKLVRGQDMWLNQESEQTRRILRCMQCGESFKSLPLLTVHMMQTQHYTKIVSSDHGRRSHKCSTYCDRELDKECIFKCKVCHEAFTDMEGLANHMIVSGHHKKQSSRPHPLTTPSNLTEGTGSLASIARQGRRKRFLPEDAHPSTVASLLEYRRKQSSDNGRMNGHHGDFKNISHFSSETKSPDSRFVKLVLCDSCGKRVDIQDFDSHIRACLKQRAEVIDALKNKLAAEEAILSRSESKLLRSGFSLTSLARFHGDIVHSRSEADSPPVLHEHRLSEDKFHYQEAARKSELPSPRDHDRSVDVNLVTKLEDSAKMCDETEVRVKKWHCSNGDGRRPSSADSRSPVPNTPSHITPLKLSFITKEESSRKDANDYDSDLRITPSPQSVKKRKLSESEESSVEKAREITPRSSSSYIFYDKTVDFTSSALHQLDMFSRGLKFSPPRQNLSPDHKSSHQASKLGKRKEFASHGGPGSKKDLPRSPAPVASPALSSHHRSESPDSLKREVTFDIIDPNTIEDHGASKSSALEAMESFIHKSFSSKSDMRTSNLATMFSPFRNCFPLPAQGGALPAISDPTMSHFAKFSKFFRMVPGMSPFPDVASATESPTKMVSNSSETRLPLNQDKAASIAKKVPSKPYTLNSNKTSSGVKFPIEFPLENATQETYSGSKKTSDASQSSKKYKYSSISSIDLSQINSKLNSFLSSASGYGAFNKNNSSDHLSPKKMSTALEPLNEDLGKKRKKDPEAENSSPEVKKVYIKTESQCSDEQEGVSVKVEQKSDEDDEPCKTHKEHRSLSIELKSETDDARTSSPRPGRNEIQNIKSAHNVHVNIEQLSACRGNSIATIKNLSESADEAAKQNDDPEESNKAPAFSTTRKADSSKNDWHNGSDDVGAKQAPGDNDDAPEPKSLEAYPAGDMHKTGDQSVPQRFCKSNDNTTESETRQDIAKQGEECGFTSKDELAKEDLTIKIEVDDSSDTENGQGGGQKSSENSRVCLNNRAIKTEMNDQSESDYDRPTDVPPTCVKFSERSRPSSCESGRAQASPRESSCDSSTSSGHMPSDAKRKGTKGGEKKSALDSLSSFVYSQPLTSEHPLDSLQRLLSTNDLIHATQHERHLASSSSHKCQTPDLGAQPMNPTGSVSGNGAGSGGGCSSDENDEGDASLAEGGASEGEVSEYKCAACNRRFASKGSYRYHLSRCHLSSVKKYGIKEAFNMSPYVYLPLDHTAKFSKYYQMARELANKGK